MVYHVNTGLYILGYKQDPREVARVAYGDGHLYHVLLKHNTHSNWQEGDVIEVPNKKGRQTIVEDGEILVDLIKRMFPNQPTHLYVDRYLQWNAHILPEDLAGTMVFIPER